MLAPVEDVEAAVPEAELDEREALRSLAVNWARDPRREDGEVLRRLVDPVVQPPIRGGGRWMQARRGLDVAQGAIVLGGP
jgi:hypothetical protein